MLTAQHSPLMSPLVWDLAHIAHYEELWLVRELGVGPATDPRFDDVYDAFKHPRAERPRLDILDPDGARAFGAAVRGRVTGAEIPPTGEARVDALLAGDFVYRMVVRHEHQHIETMLATMQLMDDASVPAGDGPGRASARPGAVTDEVLVPAGPFVMGTDADPWAYDNERPAHAVELPAYLIDATPVTNGQYGEFIDRRRLRRSRATGPSPDGSGARRRRSRTPSSGRTTPTAGTAGASAATSRCPRSSRCSTCAGTRPTRTHGGPANDCRPRPSGRRRRAGTRARATA